jgi:thiamine monophosphate synthase
MKKIAPKRLGLSTETIRALEQPIVASGGRTPLSVVTICSAGEASVCTCSIVAITFVGCN